MCYSSVDLMPFKTIQSIITVPKFFEFCFYSFDLKVCLHFWDGIIFLFLPLYLPQFRLQGGLAGCEAI